MRNNLPQQLATAALAAAVFHCGPLVAAPVHRNPLDEQRLGLAEQDLAICLDKEGRDAEAVLHYRAALGHDALLKAPWANLAAQALNAEETEQAVHLASMALLLDPTYSTARAVLENAAPVRPPEDERRALARKPCPDEPGGAAASAGPAAEAGGDVLGVGPRQACLERRAGLLASIGTESRAPIDDLARLELGAGHPSAALLLTLASAGMEEGAAPGLQAPAGGALPEGAAPEPSRIIARALEDLGDPCGSTIPQLPPGPRAPRCEAIRSKRAEAERLLGADLRAFDEPRRVAARLRLESLIEGGMDAAPAARRWRIEQARGDRPLSDLGGMALRLGVEWIPADHGDASGCEIRRRKPGDAAFVACVVTGLGADPAAGLGARLRPRRPAKLDWTPETALSTDPATLLSARLTAQTDEGARVDGSIWLAQSPRAPGLTLVILGFPGTAGLGSSGLEQSGEEIREAMQSAVLMPERWVDAKALGDSDELPFPVYGIREQSDERRQPWRTYPAAEYSLALPPGMIAARYDQAPRASAPARPSAALWFRGRFKDRDGVDVVVGDASHAASVDVLDVPGKASTRPVADPGASPIAVIDMTPAFASITGADQATLSRYHSSTEGFEWLVARLAYGPRLVEISIPVFQGGESIALYWIASTVRAAGGPPPDAPVDLSSSLGIAFFRPPPEEKGQSFYKEGDLRSRDFTMLVARGYAVAMNTDAVDAFPVKITRPQGDVRIRLDRWDRGERGATADGASAHAGTDEEQGPIAAGSPSTAWAASPSSARERLTKDIQAWLDREGFELAATPTMSAMERPGRSGAEWGIESKFAVRPAPGRAAASPAAPPWTGGSPPSPSPPPDAPDTSALGAATLLRARDGRTYVFLSLRMGTEARQRDEEIRLMLSSLRLTGKRRS